MTLDWSVFCKDTLTGEAAPRCFSFLFGVDPNVDPTYLDWLFIAWGWTLSVAGLSLVLALLMGVTIGTLRTLQPTNFLNKGLTFLGTVWVELFRNIPLLVQVFLWYHVVPSFFPVMKSFPSYLLVSIALGLFTSARIAEQVRAGIQALPAGQNQAATAMGLRLWQRVRLVILPQALRMVLPSLTSEAMNIVKNSSVAFAVSVTELTLFAMQAQEETARGLEIYAGVTLLYMLTTLLVNRMMALIEARTRVPGLLAVT